jgi:hypothetical protein
MTHFDDHPSSCRQYTIESSSTLETILFFSDGATISFVHDLQKLPNRRNVKVIRINDNIDIYKSDEQNLQQCTYSRSLLVTAPTKHTLSMHTR